MATNSSTDRGLTRRRRYAALSARARMTLLVLTSLVALMSEVFLIRILWSARDSIDLAFWILPLIHLLPWFAGMQLLWSLRGSVRDGIMDSAAADFCKSRIIFLLLFTYGTLSTCESFLGSAWRFGTKGLMF